MVSIDDSDNIKQLYVGYIVIQPGTRTIFHTVKKKLYGLNLHSSSLTGGHSIALPNIHKRTVELSTQGNSQESG